MKEMDNSDGLKECPFCNAVSEIKETGWCYDVNCTNDDCSTEIWGYININDAIKAWNNRPQEAKLTAIVKELREALEKIVSLAHQYNYAEVDIAQQALLRAEEI